MRFVLFYTPQPLSGMNFDYSELAYRDSQQPHANDGAQQTFSRIWVFVPLLWNMTFIFFYAMLDI